MSKIKLENIINNSPYAFYFLVVDKFLDIDLPQIKNFHKIYLSDYSSIKIKNSGKLLSNPAVIKYIKTTSGSLIPVIIPFKPSAKIDIICQQNNWINISNPGPINRFLENKIKFAKLCQKYHLPIIPFSIDIFSEENFLKYQHLYGPNLVIQTHFGWAGNSTFSASSWDQIKDKISSMVIVKYSPFIKSSYSLLNNCCLTKFGLIQSPPALQYTGISPYTKNPFTTVGRQWPSFAPPKIIKIINKISEDFGQIIKEIGYKGFFGLDFLVSNDKIFLLECNPRLTASFAFYTKLEIDQKINPLFYFHLIEFLKLNYSINLKFEKERFNNKKIIGSELTPKNKNNYTYKKLNFSYPLSKSPNHISISIKLNEKN
ncbi:MAG: ATP-grasp domain-containing protein [Candidatus Shapirobacteria bacterium]|jgi:predicted ATP-grasp superfamily ATP-dependent carboligase|nr:ATP-grasp domain-containing protein [Candidatus Shapirobacteria bacterium]